MSLAPPIEITPYDPAHRTVHPRYKTQLCKNLVERGECSYGARCSFYHPPPPTPSTANTDLDPFNPTNDDPISPIYPSKKASSTAAVRKTGRWPSSPLSYQQFGQDGSGGAVDRRTQHAPHHHPQLTGSLAGAGGAYGQWREQAELDRSDFEVRVVRDDSLGAFGRKMGSSYRTVPCKNYLAGHCPRGNLCTFKHDDAPAALQQQQPASPSHIVLDFSQLSIAQSVPHVPLASAPALRRYKTVPCKFHLPPVRPCPKGDACTFLHVDADYAHPAGQHPAGALQPLQAPPQPSSLAAPAAAAIKQVIGRQGERILINGLSATSAPPRRTERSAKPSMHPLYKTRQCKYWAADGSGSCTKGDACAFLHGPPIDASSAPSSAAASSFGGGGGADGGAGGSREEGKHPLWRTEPCLYFQKGTCTRDEQCNFLHVLAPSLLPTSAPTQPGAPAVRPLGRKACLYLLRAGACRFGDNCRYRHELLPVDRAAFATSEQQQGQQQQSQQLQAAGVVDATQSLNRHAVFVEDDDYDDDDEGDIEIVLHDPHSPDRAGSSGGLASPAPTPRRTTLSPPATPGKRRTRSMSEVGSPTGQIRR